VRTGVSLGPFLWSPLSDLVVFFGSAVVALAMGFVASRSGVSGVSDLSWLVLVLGIDVAHVHATWFRTYFDREELGRHPVRYLVLPVVAYAGLWLCYRSGALVFWRVVAYLAVFHFVRQQAGWVALYRAAARRAGLTAGRFDRWIDDGAIYAATLYPLLVWHASPQSKPFSWFVSGDFSSLPLAPWLGAFRAGWGLFLALFFARQALNLLRSRRFELGKSVVVAMTALTWYFGIVESESDFVFTASNVIPHGAPYIWLLYRYTRERNRRARGFALGEVAAAGLMPFVLLLVGLAFVEELGWDRLVDHERSWLFGSSAELSSSWLGLVVPLLVLPQVTHYLLDGWLWRRTESCSRPAQRAAVGLESNAAAPLASVALGGTIAVEMEGGAP
jgi:hypothetical protein